MHLHFCLVGNSRWSQFKCHAFSSCGLPLKVPNGNGDLCASFVCIFVNLLCLHVSWQFSTHPVMLIVWIQFKAFFLVFFEVDSASNEILDATIPCSLIYMNDPSHVLEQAITIPETVAVASCWVAGKHLLAERFQAWHMTWQYLENHSRKWASKVEKCICLRAHALELELKFEHQAGSQRSYHLFWSLIEIPYTCNPKGMYNNTTETIDWLKDWK